MVEDGRSAAVSSAVRKLVVDPTVRQQRRVVAEEVRRQAFTIGEFCGGAAVGVSTGTWCARAGWLEGIDGLSDETRWGVWFEDNELVVAVPLESDVSIEEVVEGLHGSPERCSARQLGGSSGG